MNPKSVTGIAVVLVPAEGMRNTIAVEAVIREGRVISAQDIADGPEDISYQHSRASIHLEGVASDMTQSAWPPDLDAWKHHHDPDPLFVRLETRQLPEKPPGTKRLDQMANDGGRTAAYYADRYANWRVAAQQALDSIQARNGIEFIEGCDADGEKLPGFEEGLREDFEPRVWKESYGLPTLRLANNRGKPRLDLTIKKVEEQRVPRKETVIEDVLVSSLELVSG